MSQVNNWIDAGIHPITGLMHTVGKKRYSVADYNYEYYKTIDKDRVAAYNLGKRIRNKAKTKQLEPHEVDFLQVYNSVVGRDMDDSDRNSILINAVSVYRSASSELQEV